MSVNEDCKKLCEGLVARYEASKRSDEAEPEWALDPYDMAYDFVNGGVESIKENWDQDGSDEDICEFVIEHLSPLLIKDGIEDNTFLGRRIFQDGFKVGSKSWIFMGRKESEIETWHIKLNEEYGNKKLFIVRREIPAEFINKEKGLTGFLYCGYFLEKEYKVEVGGHHSSDDLIKEITKIFEGYAVNYELKNHKGVDDE